MGLERCHLKIKQKKILKLKKNIVNEINVLKHFVLKVKKKNDSNKRLIETVKFFTFNIFSSFILRWHRSNLIELVLFLVMQGRVLQPFSVYFELHFSIILFFLVNCLSFLWFNGFET